MPWLGLDGLPVAEGYIDVALAVYREVVRQGVEGVEGELGQLLRHLLKSGQEILDAGFLRLRLADLLVQLVESGFEGFVPGGQVVVLFLVGLLVEGGAGVLGDVLLDRVRDNLRFFKEPVSLGLGLLSVKEQRRHLASIGDDRVLCGQQLVCRRQEDILNLLVRQVRQIHSRLVTLSGDIKGYIGGCFLHVPKYIYCYFTFTLLYTIIESEKVR